MKRDWAAHIATFSDTQHWRAEITNTCVLRLRCGKLFPQNNEMVGTAKYFVLNVLRLDMDVVVDYLVSFHSPIELCA